MPDSDSITSATPGQVHERRRVAERLRPIDQHDLGLFKPGCVELVQGGSAEHAVQSHPAAHRLAGDLELARDLHLGDALAEESDSGLAGEQSLYRSRTPRRSETGFCGNQDKVLEHHDDPFLFLPKLLHMIRHPTEEKPQPEPLRAECDGEGVGWLSNQRFIRNHPEHDPGTEPPLVRARGCAAIASTAPPRPAVPAPALPALPGPTPGTARPSPSG